MFICPERLQAFVQQDGDQGFYTAERTLSDRSDHSWEDHRSDIVRAAKDLLHVPAELYPRDARS